MCANGCLTFAVNTCAQAALTRAVATAALKDDAQLAGQYLSAQEAEEMDTSWEVVEDADDVLVEDAQGDAGRKAKQAAGE